MIDAINFVFQKQRRLMDQEERIYEQLYDRQVRLMPLQFSNSRIDSAVSNFALAYKLRL